MSENEIVCTECGRVRPTQVTVCPKHDFRHEIDKHCDHCENEVAAQLEAEWNAGVEKRNAEREAQLNADAQYQARKAAADAKGSGRLRR